MAKKTTVPRPRLKPAQITGRATEALALAGEDRALLEPRLGAGLLEGAQADLARVVEVVSGATEKRAEKVASTATQNELAAQVIQEVMAIRTAINVSGLSAAARKRYGVGLRMSPKTIKSVVAGANAVLNAAEETPDELRSVGVLPSDLEQLRALLAALTGADTVQEGKKITAKQATAERDATLRRLDDAVRKIAAAGVLAHRNNPERRAKYEALLGGTSKSKNGGGRSTEA